MEKRLEDHLKKKNLRLTSARQIIYQILSDSYKSMSAKDVFEKTKTTSNLKTDQASVYRNLNLFTEIGLTHRIQDGKYSICKHGHHDGDHNHIHIVANCTSCGETYEIENHTEDLCHIVKRINSFIDSFAGFSGLTVQGTCKRCSK